MSGKKKTAAKQPMSCYFQRHSHRNRDAATSLAATFSTEVMFVLHHGVLSNRPFQQVLAVGSYRKFAVIMNVLSAYRHLGTLGRV